MDKGARNATPSPSTPSTASSPNSPKAAASVGVRLRVREDWELPIVTHLCAGGSAKRSGMFQENDCLLRVAGKDLRGMEAADVMLLLSGPPNSKVRIRILRDGVSFDCTIARAILTPEKKKKSRTRLSDTVDTNRGSGHRKLTDREKADRMLRGDHLRHRNRISHGPGEVKLTQKEVRELCEREKIIHEGAQRKADAWYDEHVAMDERLQRHRIKDAAVKGEPWSLMSLFAPVHKDEDKPWHEKIAHRGAEIRTDTRMALKNKIRSEKDKATAVLGMAILNFKVRKAGEDLEYIMTGKRPKQGFFAARKTEECCGFCVGARA